MTTKNILDLTQHTASSQLSILLAHGQPFVIQSLSSEGYLVNAYTARLERAKGKNAVRWYGYKKVGKRLCKLYIGKSEYITIDTIRAIANRYNDMLEADYPTAIL